MRLPELLRSIDGLSYGQRVRLLADRAPELAGLLGELGRGSSFERVLGLQIAEVTRDTAYVNRMLRDPDPLVHGRAIAAVLRGVPVPDDDLRILYDDAPAALRSKLVALVRRQRREHLAVRLIDEHRARWGDVAATGLLDAVDGATLARLLPELAYCVTPGNWRRLARHHPEQVLTFARETLPSGADRDEWWRGVGHGVAAALDFDLIKEALPAHDLPVAVIDVIGPLADRDPAGVLALLLAPDRRGAVYKALTPALRRRLYRYADDELVELGRILWPSLTELLRELAPSRRGRLFEAVTKDVDLGQAQLPPELLQVLPYAVRIGEARRMLALPVVAEDGALRRRVTAYLPYDEAFELLSGEVRDPEAAVRSSVYQAVIRSATRPEQVVAAVTWAAERVRNDQDLVRLAVLHTVADVSPTLLTAALTEPLEMLLEDGLNARDTSWATRRALGRIAERAVVHGALGNESRVLEWGLRAHARLSENIGELSLDRIADNLPRGREAAVYAVLRPAIEAAARRNEFALAFAVAQAFGRRAWRIDHLQDVLEQAVWSNQEYTVERACRYWLDAPSTRSERVERIIRRDVRLARWHPVWWLVTELRTDLLDPVFDAADTIRRFDRNSPSWEVPDYALRLWLPRQQARYAALLVGVARDHGMPEWYRAAAVKTLGHVPTAGRPVLDEFLASDDVLLQEAALAGLAWTNRPDQALPLLLSHAGDDRARIAVYAAARAARFVRPSLLPGLLQPVLTRDGVKVTARKEAVRLLGELRAPGAGAVLTETWAGAHRDVRATIARTVSQYLLYDPAAWAVLEQAVHDSPATAVVLGARSAYDVPLAYRSRYADLLIAVTTRSEPEVVGPTLLALRGWARYSPAAAGVCADFVTDLSLRSRVWSDAIYALVSIVASNPPDGVRELVDAVRLLVRLEEDPALPNAAADRDRPARQRLRQLVGQLTGQLAGRSASARSHLSPVAAELAAPDYLGLRLPMLLLAAPTAADAVPALHEAVADDLLAASAAAELLRARLQATDANWEPADLLPLTESLTQATDPAAALLAHALLTTAAPRAGWPVAWRRLLVALRNNPDPGVRRAALDLTNAPE
ncbi:hypothetical protein [Kribbella sp. NPDC004536]|uniref:hypothetical protein n=1 Tax=Kribbella sp. NPDC004536 TaxID=3364106 RepID=UPI0036AB37D0